MYNSMDRAMLRTLPPPNPMKKDPLYKPGTSSLSPPLLRPRPGTPLAMPVDEEDNGGKEEDNKEEDKDKGEEGDDGDNGEITRDTLLTNETVPTPRRLLGGFGGNYSTKWPYRPLDHTSAHSPAKWPKIPMVLASPYRAPTWSFPPSEPLPLLPSVATSHGERLSVGEDYVDIHLRNPPHVASENEVSTRVLSWPQAAFDSGHFSDQGFPSPVMSQVSSIRSHDSGYASDMSRACSAKPREGGGPYHLPLIDYQSGAGFPTPSHGFIAPYYRSYGKEPYPMPPRTSTARIFPQDLSSPLAGHQRPGLSFYNPVEGSRGVARCCFCLKSDMGMVSQVPCPHTRYYSCHRQTFEGYKGDDICELCRKFLPGYEDVPKASWSLRPGESNETSTSPVLPNSVSSERILSLSPPPQFSKIEELRTPRHLGLSAPADALVDVDAVMSPYDYSSSLEFDEAESAARLPSPPPSSPRLTTTRVCSECGWIVFGDGSCVSCTIFRPNAAKAKEQSAASKTLEATKYGHSIPERSTRSEDNLNFHGSPSSAPLLNSGRPSTGHDPVGTRNVEWESLEAEFATTFVIITEVDVCLRLMSEIKDEFRDLLNELQNLAECLNAIFDLDVLSRHEISANAVKTTPLICYTLMKSFHGRMLEIFTGVAIIDENDTSSITRKMFDAEMIETARILQACVANDVLSLNRRLSSLKIHASHQSSMENSQKALHDSTPKPRVEKMADLIGSPQGPEDSTDQGDSPGNSVSSDDSESADHDDYLMTLLAKHRILANLMREVYRILGYNPTETPGQSPSDAGDIDAGPLTHQGDSERGSCQHRDRKGKKRVLDRDSQPPDEDEDDRRKKRPRGEPDPDVNRDGRLYACPFSKYDSRKYSSNQLTGKKFRTCAGPGWENIAKLRQHLKRTHLAPIQCRRCWVDFPSEAALTEHSRSDDQCPVLPQGPTEYIPQHKWEIIKSRWGATWNFIFEILFPSVTIPSCYYDDIPLAPLLLPPSPPASQDLEGYESYSRKELPRLIEGILDSMIHADKEPLDERSKSLLLEVVRSGHSLLGHRWDMIKGGSSSKPPPSPTAEPNASFSAGNIPPSPHPISASLTNIESTVVPSIYQVPPALSGPIADATFYAFEESQNTFPALNRPVQSDSGYESQQLADRFCSCDPSVDLGYQESQNYTFFADSFVDPRNISSSVEQSIHSEYWPAENSGASGSGFGTVGISQERTVVRCSFCGGWRDK